MSGMREIESSGIGLDMVQQYTAQQTWASTATAMLFATRGTVDFRVWRAHERLHWPMNQNRCKLDAVGLEVGEAYEQLFENATTEAMRKIYPWLLTYEEDNLPEPEAYMKLISAIRHCPDCRVPIGNADHCPDGHKSWDGLAGLYFTKVKPPAPMAFGDPKKPRDFTTQNVLPYIEAKDPLDQIIEVNSVPMGFTIFRSDLAPKLSKPWFKTAEPEIGEDGSQRGAIGQDMWFCIKAREEAGARLGIHCGVKVGHLDVKTGKVY